MSTSDLQGIGNFALQALAVVPAILMLLWGACYVYCEICDFISDRGGLKILIEDHPWWCLLAGVLLLAALASALAFTLSPEVQNSTEWGPPPVNWIAAFLIALVAMAFMGWIAFASIAQVGGLVYLIYLAARGLYKWIAKQPKQYVWRGLLVAMVALSAWGIVARSGAEERPMSEPPRDWVETIAGALLYGMHYGYTAIFGIATVALMVFWVYQIVRCLYKGIAKAWAKHPATRDQPGQ